MLIEAERLNTGTGFLCSFRKGGANQAVGILIADKDTPVVACKEALHQLNGYFAEINKISGQAGIHDAPIVFDLNHSTNIGLAVDTALNGSHSKILFTCSDWKIYARLCEQTGITRADHIALAQKGALMKDDIIDADKGHKIQSHAKSFFKSLKRGQIFTSENAPLEIEALKHAESVVDSAKIIYLDKIKAQMAPANGESWEYHLPYRHCLFEVNNKNDSSAEFYDGFKGFILASADPDTWKVRLWFFGNGGPNPDHYMLLPVRYTYDPEEPIDKCTVAILSSSYTREDRNVHRLCGAMLGAIYPVIAAINSPTVTLKRHVPSMDRLTHKKSSYATHTVDVETYTEGRKLVYKSDNDPKFLYNLAAHDRRAHKRRRPRTSITAPQDVKVRATVVGTPKKGAIARVFRAIEPEP